MNKVKISYIRKIIISLIVLSVIWYGYYLYHYSLPWKDDFQVNGERYMEIVNLLNTDEYKDVVSIWGNMKCLEFINSTPYYCQENIQYEQKYIDIMDTVAKIKNTYFSKCPNGVIKISKVGWINRIFEVVYVYSKDGFPELPEYMKEKINNQFITYLNYDGTYSGSNVCRVK